jgi:hypothetical protein
MSTPPEPTPPDPTPPTPPEPTPPADPPARTFSQEDVDRIVQERLARAKSTPPADYDELKKKAAEFDKIEEANKTELEKAREQVAKAEERAAKISEQARETRLRSTILAEAARVNRHVVDPEAVVVLLDRSKLEFDDDGEPTNITKVMDELLEARPYLVAQQGGGARGNADMGARGVPAGVKQLTEADLKTMTSEQIVAARKAGQLIELGVAP